jgi:predicted  nucleic acid-binding Zn-ribbon protein
MKKEFELLLEFDKSIKILEENQKILLDKTVYENLKEVKTSYENYKSKYKVFVEKLKKTTELCENISKEIEFVEEELSSKESILLNHCGSDIHKIKNTQNSISSLKEKVSIANKELDMELIKEEKFNKEIKLLLNRLMKLKENFFYVKDELKEKVDIANKNIKIYTEKISSIQNKIPEEILEVYFEISKKKKDPIAMLKEHTCLGCKLSISAVTLDECKKGNKIILCNNCGRIILPVK